MAAIPVTLILEGNTIDRISQGKAAKLTPDGKMDSVFTVHFAAGTGPHSIAMIDLKGPGTTDWDTDPNSGAWILGVAPDLLSDLSNQPDGSLSDFTVPDGGSFTLFSSQAASPANDYTLTLTYTDGTTAQTTLKNDHGILAVLKGETVDRLGTGNKAKLTPDGKNDGAFSVYFPAGIGEHTITRMALDGINVNAHWDTDSTTSNWTIAVAQTMDGTFLNQADDSVSFTVPDGGSFVFFIPDDRPDHYIKSTYAYTLNLVFADGLIPSIHTRHVGDVNEDDQVNILDATASLRFAVGTLTPTDRQKILGDVNGDGKLNILDTSAILKKAVGG
jgi:hypothetical protein